MDSFLITGGQRLKGRLAVSGSKNAALPLMAAALLTDQPVTLRNVPRLRDIRNMIGLLGELGVEASPWNEPGEPLTLRTTDPTPVHARYDIVKTMRASICALGPMLAGRGHARLALPGGCAIGPRPVDLHLRGLRALGARITLNAGDVVAEAPDGLRGATIFLGGPFGSTVLGTANILSAAVLARGETIIESAACEPEIVDLARLLTAMGAHIEGAGSPRITIHGVDSLHGADHTVMPDRIEAATYIMAAAATNGSLTLDNCPYDDLLAVLDRLDEIGVAVTPHKGRAPQRPCTVDVECRSRRLAPVQVTTQPHPGFPTDVQAQIMALLCLADGHSVVTEKIFPERFLHVAELQRMGAQLFRQGPTVIVSGVPNLVGAPVMASDLRASASLVIAALAAEGETRIDRVYHLDRGYETMETRLTALGAHIERIEAPATLSHPAPMRE